ncbi:MAG: thioredoxin domain-containing protein [Candidatus Thorarchaeota archaeon]
MSEQKKNHLSTEKSPYLIQHMENPVDWYPWGEEAFNRAKEEDKPIFLSIGYSTCHWCHVMAHESFEDNEVAELMNEVFISIKVDREERPDIDNVYMKICQMMTGSGGWPLTIIMTPEKKPFFTGTYFPRETRFGRIGLIDLIKRIKELWNTQREELLNSAEKITFSLQNIDQESPGEKFSKETLKKAYRQLSIQYDNKNGGFGDRPKFPTPHNLIFLLRYWKRTGDQKALEIVEKTLQSMRKGGIYDHIGFGFHRYSTDSIWLVPHFEKMLYDQALIAIAYIEAYQATKKDLYKRSAQEIFSYVLRDLLSPEGGFYSAEDADSEGEEGKFYVWTLDELSKILEKNELELLIETFNISESGNYLEEASREKTGKNILHFSMYPKEELKDELEAIRQKLFKYRKNRIHPHKDDKILTDWNGLMIAALAKGSVAFDNEEYLIYAKNSINFILSNLLDSNKRLFHRYKDGTSEINGYLTDYAFFIWGLLEVFEANFDIFYLKTALNLHKIQIEDFWDDNIGGFYFTAKNSEKLLTRQKEIYDGAIPSGNSIAMLNLLRLSYITGNYELEEKADRLNRVFSEKIKANPLAYTQFLVAIDFVLGPSYSLVISGKSREEDTIKFIDKIMSEYLPNKVLMLRKMEQEIPDIDRFSNFVEYFYEYKDKTTAYVCINKTCKPPTNEINKTLEYLNSNW